MNRMGRFANPPGNFGKKSADNGLDFMPRTSEIKIEELRILLFRVACRVPVRTSFGVMRDRPALLVCLRDADGAQGWGEVWCNFPDCGAEHRAKLLETVVGPLVLGHTFPSPGAMWTELCARTRLLALQTGEQGPLAQVLAGVDIAMWDLAARKAGQPLYQFLGRAENAAGPSLPVYASGINPDVVQSSIFAAREQGFRSFKIKVGFAESIDQKNVADALQILQPGETLALDANQNWNLEQAQKMIANINENFREFGPAIEWLEEPLAADEPWSSWRKLQLAGSPPLAAGENLRGVSSFYEAIAESALSVIQPDLCKWGGFSGCLPVALAVRKAGKRYCPHYLGGGIGLLASAHLLAAVGGDGLLEVDVNENPLRESLARPYPEIEEGCFVLGKKSGLDVEPDVESGVHQPVINLHLR